MIRIEVDAKVLDALRALCSQRVDAGFASALSGLLDSARQSAPRKTGALAASISLARTGRLSALLVYGASHASYLYHGTGIYGPVGRPIVILPRGKRALWWPGAAHPVRKAVQRGIPPRDFVSDAAAGLAADFIRGFLDSG